MDVLTKAQILDADDLPSELVDVPEWGGLVRVRTMTGVERDAFEQAIMEGRGDDRTVNLRNIRAKLAALTITNGDGVLMFGDAEVHALGRKSALALDRIFGVAQRLNGLTGEDVDELAKNSSSAPNESSGST